MSSPDFPMAISSDVLRAHVLAGIITENRFLATYYNHVTPDYFASEEERWIVTTALDHYGTYEAAPTHEILAMESERQVSNGQLDPALAGNITLLLKRIPATIRVEERHVRDYAFKTMGDLMRKEALILAAQATLADIQRGRDSGILARFEKAMDVGKVDDQIGYYLFKDLALWMDAFADTDETVTPTAIPSLDAALDGGARGGELALWMAPTSRGKSHGLIWVGKVAALVGRRVLHVTLEMSERATHARYAASVTGIDSRQIWEKQGSVYARMQREGEIYAGDVIVKAYPPHGVTTREVRNILDRQKAMGEPIDVLVVDYGDLIDPAHKSPSEQTYVTQGRAFVELRGIAVTYNIPCWTAVQTNRSGYGAADFDLNSIADAYDKAKIADYIIGMSQTPEQYAASEMTLIPLKMRTSVARQRIDVQIDWRRSSITEISPDMDEFTRDEDYFA